MGVHWKDETQGRVSLTLVDGYWTPQQVRFAVFVAFDYWCSSPPLLHYRCFPLALLPSGAAPLRLSSPPLLPPVLSQVLIINHLLIADTLLSQRRLCMPIPAISQHVPLACLAVCCLQSCSFRPLSLNGAHHRRFRSHWALT